MKNLAVGGGVGLLDILVVSLFLGCSGGADEGGNQPGDLADSGSDLWLGGDEFRGGLDTVEGQDGVDGADVRDVVVPQAVLAFRLETRFGTTRQWKGVTTLNLSGLIHSENDRGEACEKVAEARYLDQLSTALAEADFLSWPVDSTDSAEGTCPADTFLLVLLVQYPGSGEQRAVKFCENRAGELNGGEKVLQVISKLSADARQNGDCDRVPFVLGRPVPVSSMGYDDGMTHMLSVARFENPDLCLIVYAGYSTEVYQTTILMDVSPDYVSEILGMYFPAQETNAFFEPLKAFCPGAADLIQDASFVSNLDPGAAVFLFWEKAGVPSIWMAVKGVLGVQPYVGEGPEGQAAQPMVFNVNGIEFHPLRGFPSSPSLSWDPWTFEWLESTMFQTDTMGIPE
jgi:hypothetical protein